MSLTGHRGKGEVLDDQLAPGSRHRDLPGLHGGDGEAGPDPSVETPQEQRACGPREHVPVRPERQRERQGVPDDQGSLAQVSFGLGTECFDDLPLLVIVPISPALGGRPQSAFYRASRDDRNPRVPLSVHGQVHRAPDLPHPHVKGRLRVEYEACHGHTPLRSYTVWP